MLFTNGEHQKTNRGRPKGGRQDSVQRFQLALPKDLHSELQTIAGKDQTSIQEIIKRFLKYGMLVYSILNKPDTKLIIREGTIEREIVLL